MHRPIGMRGPWAWARAREIINWVICTSANWHRVGEYGRGMKAGGCKAETESEYDVEITVLLLCRL
jgi:hypothetical protein